MQDLQIIYRLLHYSFRYWKRFLALLVVALFGVGVEVAKPLPLKIIIDNVLTNQTLPAFFALFFENNGTALTKEYLLVWTIGLAILLAVASAGFSMLVAGLTINLAQRLVYDFSLELFNKLQQLSLSYYGRNQVGDLLQRVNADVYVVYFVAAQIALPVIISTISLCAMFYVMAHLNLTLSLVAAAVIPLLAISLFAFSKPMDATTARQFQTQGELMAFMQQTLTAVKVVQGFARESFMQTKLAERALL